MNKQVPIFSPLTRRKQISLSHRGVILWAISFVFLFSFFAVPKFAHAGFLDNITNKECMELGNCTLVDVAEGFVKLTELLIGSIGALALVYFIWGGIQWLTSYGNQQKVQKGRDIMLQTVIALIVAFVSYILVEFFINDLLHGKECLQIDKTTGECTQYKDAVELGSSSGGSTTNSSSCANQAAETPCNTGQANYICSGGSDNRCITKCEFKSSRQNETHLWSCGTPSATDEVVPNLCPGGTDNVCIKGAPKP